MVYVNHHEPVRLAESVQARVWVKGADGTLVKSDNKMTLQEGSYNVIDDQAPPTPTETKK